MAAESVLMDVAAKIIGRLGSLALEGSGLLWNVKDEFRKMNNSVTAIKAVVLDAEEKQDISAGVREWLERLKDVALDVDDLLDDFSTEALHRQLVTQNKMGKKVRIFFSKSNQLVYAHRMSRKLKEITGKLDEIVNDGNNFGFIERRPEARAVIRKRTQTHSIILDEEVIGREEEKKTIIELLLNDDVNENVSVVSIVGIGGLGKTALTRLVYNDEIIKYHFELTMWVSVSDNFDVECIVAEILECSTSKGINQLQQDLKKKIDGKRYLLVLDDVWNENKEQWLRLKSLLIGAAKGSRIIVTTRLLKVAEITSPLSSFDLKGLDEVKSWDLFTQIAFENGEEAKNQYLVAIGKEIVRKCMGVPLAIRTIGSMLYFKNSERDWLYFKNTDLVNQEGIFPILKLSYDHLSPHLKICFAYCSLFPKGCRIERKTLIQLWNAQGFTQPFNENRCIEDVGEEYFMDLYWRSFFQDIQRDEYGDIFACKMNGLIHDLAQSVAGEDCIMTNWEGEKILKTTRHASTTLDSPWKIPTQVAKEYKLRSFLLPFSKQLVSLDTPVHDAAITSFKCLRTLELHGFCKETLPDSIRSLKHLRYLDLSHNKLIEMLPRSVTSLHNLQTLKLSGCCKLKELPREMGKLMSLRHLELDGCDELTHMPHGLGKLTSLQTLTTFVLDNRRTSSFGHQHGGGISELNNLNNLRGSLEIKGLSSSEIAEVRAAKLVGKPFLKSLILRWKVGSDDFLLEDLQPHSKIKSLTVYNFGGLNFSDWLSSLSNLNFIYIEGCDKMQYIPPLHQLPHLQYLTLGRMSSLEYIDSDRSEEQCTFSTITSTTCTSSSSPLFFPSLKSLKLIQNPKLRGWWRSSEVAAKPVEHHFSSFSCLSEFEIYDCPNLISMPLYPNVEKFTCFRVGEKILHQFLKPPTRTATVGGSQTDTTLQSYSSSSHPSTPSRLRYLFINKIQDLQSFPKELLPNLASLRHMTINECPRLKSVSPILQNLSALLWLCLTNCSEFDLRIDEEGGDYGMRWKELSFLRSLKLRGLPKLQSLPDGLQHVTTLEYLEIANSHNLETLPEWIGNFNPSLQKLHIIKCSKLTSLPPGMQNLKSLRKLKIAGCPQLHDEDWHKIAHVPEFTDVLESWE